MLAIVCLTGSATMKLRLCTVPAIAWITLMALLAALLLTWAPPAAARLAHAQDGDGVAGMALVQALAP